MCFPSNKSPLDFILLGAVDESSFDFAPPDEEGVTRVVSGGGGAAFFLRELNEKWKIRLNIPISNTFVYLSSNYELSLIISSMSSCFDRLKAQCTME